MPSDWTDAPYVRVFVTLADDYPEVWRDDRLLAWWLRMLVSADRHYPASAPLPIDVPDVVVDSFEAADVVDRVGETRYRFHGLAVLRDRSESRGRRGGLARARAGGRSPASGKFVSSSTDQQTTSVGDQRPTSVDNQRPTSAESSVPSSVPSDSRRVGAQETDDESPVAVATLDGSLGFERENAGPANARTSEPATRHDTTRDQEPALTGGVLGRSSGTSHAGAREGGVEATTGTAVVAAPPSGPLDPLTPAARAAMVRDHGPDDADCDEPTLHPLHHRFYVGVGWVCLLCERSDPRSFDDRMIEAGGSPF